jgi:alpha-2-macroglobulin
VSAFVVNKPLMIEPVVPRFAHLGDELLVKAVLHNTTKVTGEVEVELKLDDTATLINEPRTYVPVALTKNRTQTNDGKTERRVITLKAGETTALAFPVSFVKVGTSAWQWRVHTTQWQGEALADAIESKFEVTHPSPALREVHYFSLTNASSKDDLLKQVNPQLLESDGELRLDVSRSRMSEARDALEHVLHYPYGCVEQTTSNLLPWLALGKYEPMFPDLLQKDKTQAAIQRGADRLLQMQTADGGLSYWPGGDKPLLWASAYGGFGLVKCKEWGIAVPQEALDKLAKWMSDDLRKLELKSTNKTYDLCDGALAVYTLAKLGKPEPSYQNLLYQRRDRLPETSRLFLAMAMSITKAPEKQIKDLMPPPVKNSWDAYWLGPNTADGLRLILCAQLGLIKDGDRIADELMKARNGYGHWGTTFSNAWILLGLSVSERADVSAPPVNFALDWGKRKSEFTLGGMTTASAFFDFNHDHGANPLHAEIPDGATLRGRVEVKSWPDFKTFQPVEKGFAIHRTYQRLTATGDLEEAKDLRVGDLIVVKLNIETLKPNRYIAIEDPLPSVFEPVNPEFATQNQNAKAQSHEHDWFCDFRELRNDKALFFTDEWSKIGKFELSYLARVIAEGDVLAPPSRIEAMYEPDHYGLGEIQRIQTLPMTSGNVAGK